MLLLYNLDHTSATQQIPIQETAPFALNTSPSNEIIDNPVAVPIDETSVRMIHMYENKI